MYMIQTSRIIQNDIQASGLFNIFFNLAMFTTVTSFYIVTTFRSLKIAYNDYDIALQPSI